MARIITGPEPATLKPRKRYYPWDEWSDGQWREATRHDDYDCTTASFIRQLHQILPRWAPAHLTRPVVQSQALPGTDGTPDRVWFRLTDAAQ